MKAIVLVLAIFLAILTSCEKDKIITDSSVSLEFSSDSLLFDTVFTTLGSTIRRLKVYNRSRHAVKVSDIRLAGGVSSNYQININGASTNSLTDVELAGNDSLNIFVKVTINPNSSQLPFLVKDSIEFSTNGNYQKIILTAYGQNAVFLNAALINSNTVWDKTLPYVIYNSLTVAEGVTLSIQRGSRIYFHKDAEMRVAGTLKVSGAHRDSVCFMSERLEAIYKDEPGQWTGLHFLSSSKDNQMNYASVRNGVVGIKVDSLSSTSNPKLLLTNTVVDNMQISGLHFENADVAGFNNLLINCGRHLLYAVNGGRYNFKQNTFVNTGSYFPRTAPSVYLANYSSSSGAKEMQITLINNIIWGNLQDELIVEKKGDAPFTQVVKKNLIRSRDNTLEGSGNFLNQDPQFKNPRNNNFILKASSPAANKGETLVGDLYLTPWLSKDLNNSVRLFPSDLGSYEIL